MKFCIAKFTRQTLPASAYVKTISLWNAFTSCHYGYRQGFPINDAEVSKCHLTEGRGTSHFFPLQFTVGSDTAREPSQDRKREDLTQTMWVTVGFQFSPCCCCKETLTAMASWLERWEAKLSPLQLLLTLCLWIHSLLIPKQISWTQATADLSFPDLFLWGGHHQFQASEGSWCYIQEFPCMENKQEELEVCTSLKGYNLIGITEMWRNTD